MQTNFLVIGSGISGLNFALNAAQKGQVLIVTKKKIIDSNTNYAQGGIAAVLDQTDNIKEHIQDTLEAGAFHNNQKSLEFMVKNSTAAIYRLVELGVEFAKENGKLKLTKEGGHHKNRIAYVGDYTGKEIERILVKRVKEHPSIKILENAFALKLLTKNIVDNRAQGKTCYGAQIIHKNKIENIFADRIIIATGGVGQIYSSTTNPKIATGDGLAIGLEAGCRSQDLEFIQFHPTALAKNTFPRFLISEAVRGEGAKLVNSKGEYFMENAHPLKDLAPRDIVAREIYQQLKDKKVYLDCRGKTAEHLKNRFPQIYAKLLEYGYRMEKDLIPVTPAAHYICGGIVTDIHGQTNIKNLFAFGEVTYTGVHGANRLASNSLLEALVFSNQILKKLPTAKLSPRITRQPLLTTKHHLIPQNSPHTKTAKKLKKEIQQIMWQYAGIVRNRSNIKKLAIPAIQKILKKLESIKGTNQEIAEAHNMAKVSLEILKSAYARKTSLGCHYVDEGPM
ncbi:MAG: L-aspartate oxidase [Patescibacteria group bacterium]